LSNFKNKIYQNDQLEELYKIGYFKSFRYPPSTVQSSITKEKVHLYCSKRLYSGEMSDSGFCRADFTLQDPIRVSYLTSKWLRKTQYEIIPYIKRESMRLLPNTVAEFLFRFEMSYLIVKSITSYLRLQSFNALNQTYQVLRAC
jgi:hypothetical protein